MEEECEVITAQTLETSHVAPTSVWNMGTLGTCQGTNGTDLWCPKRMTNDAYKTLFQLKEYHLLQDLFVYVETELLQQVKDSGGKHRKKRKSDLLCFVKLLKNGDLAEFVGTVTLSSSSKAKALIDEGKLLVHKQSSRDTKLSFNLSPNEDFFSYNNIPDTDISSGAILTIKMEPKENAKKGNNFFLSKKLVYFYSRTSATDRKKVKKRH